MLLTVNDDNPKSKRKKTKKFKPLKFLFTIILILTLIGGVSVAGYSFYVISKAEKIDPTKLSELLDDTSFIYDSEGNLLERVIGTENRTIVDIEKIPTHMQNAVIAIEDERFLEHNGIDIKRVFGALWHDIKTMSLEQGASTITMQLAKNLYTGADKTLDRKITDAYNAVQIEKILNKKQILYYYLNQINLGRGNYGVQAAANHYFNKDISQINLAESAMLAGIPKNPSRYSVYTTNPITKDDDLKNIQIKTLFRNDTSVDLPTDEDLAIYNKLYELGRISRYELSQLKNNEYYLRKAVLNEKAVARQKVVLKNMLNNNFITEQEYNDALNTPIEIKIGKTKQSNISSYFIDKVKYEVIDILKKSGKTDEEAYDMLVNGGLRIYSTLDQRIQNILETEINNSSNYPRTRVDDQGVLQPQVAAVVLDHSNGYVRGLIGGRGISGSKIFNRAINPRQPGSSIKPLAVYLPALDHGFTAASPIDDSPITEGNYKPKNYSTYMGPTTVRNLIIHSSNVGAVKVAKQVKPYNMIKYLKNLGISTVITPDMDRKYNDENLSLALGGMTKGATPLDMASAYGSIANKGVHITPVFVKKIITSSGTLVFENKQEIKKITSPQNAYIMTSMLQDVVNSGTGTGARLRNQPVAGKTGTTNEEKDVWFVGYTPYYAASVWIGEDIPKDLNMTSNVPTALWGKIMAKVHTNLPRKSFVMPSNIVGVEICDETGLLATEHSKRVRKEIFVAGTTPKEYCPMITEEEPDEGLLPDEEEKVEGENPNTPNESEPSKENKTESIFE